MQENKVIKKEVPVANFIDFSHHVSDSIIKLHSGAYVKSIKLMGAAHESNGNDVINGWDRQLVSMLRGVSSPNISVYSYVVRREINQYPGGEFSNSFADRFNSKYQMMITKDNMLINELYLAFVYQPMLGIVSKSFGWLLNSGLGSREQSTNESIEILDKTVSRACESLSVFSPKTIGCYEFNGTKYSGVLELYSYLINGKWQRFPLPRRDISKIFASARPGFGKDGDILIKGANHHKFANVIGINEYPAKTTPDKLDDILSLPFEFVLAQSFTFLQKSIAAWSMDLQQGHLQAAKDGSVSQTEAIDDAMDDLISNEIIMGIHSMSMIVYGKSIKSTGDNTDKVISLFSDAGIKANKEDIAAAAGFFSMLPGNFKYRLNPAKINNRNFAHFSSLHNYPIGRISGNQWGDCVAMFKTTSGSPYYFNFHQSEFTGSTLDPNNFEPASTLIVGKVGTGKTVLEGFLLTMLQKFRRDSKMTCVIFDKDQSVGILCRALGGNYYALKTGHESGLNPFHIEETHQNISFIVGLVKFLASRSCVLTIDDERHIYDEVNNVMAMPKPLRRLSSVKNRMRSKSDSVYNSLVKWCVGGEFGWLFDNAEDTLTVDCPIVGFDVSDFLGHDEIRSPLMMYLLHRVEMLLDGRRLPIFMEEFGVLLSSIDPVFRKYAKKAVVTYRKKNSFFVGLTQDVSQLLAEGEAGKDLETIINQVSTKIFLPNPLAKESDYVGKFALTKKEYELVRGFGEKSRQMLIKQGHSSVVAILDLKNGFEDDLAVLSSNTKTAELCETLVDKYGTDTDVWLPVFQKERLGG